MVICFFSTVVLKKSANVKPFLLLVKAADHGILPELTSEFKGTTKAIARLLFAWFKN